MFLVKIPAETPINILITAIAIATKIPWANPPLTKSPKNAPFAIDSKSRMPNKITQKRAGAIGTFAGLSRRFFCTKISRLSC